MAFQPSKRLLTAFQEHRLREPYIANPCVRQGAYSMSSLHPVQGTARVHILSAHLVARLGEQYGIVACAGAHIQHLQHARLPV